MKKIGMRISMALQGNFNTTRLFLNIDTNYDGKIELSEFEDFYKMMDTNSQYYILFIFFLLLGETKTRRKLL